MTSLGVSDVFVQDGTAWCQVQCRRGVLRVGNQLTSLTRPDGSVIEVNLTVAGIELASGQVMELDTYMTGRVRLTGSGVDAIQPGSSLDNTPQWQFTTDVPPAWPGIAGTRGALAESERPRLIVDEAVELSRVMTAFRLVLAIPQLIAVWALSVAAEVVIVIGWFGALFTGRLPEWAGEYLENYLQYQARVYGFLYLLTDDYPPFSFSSAGSPVHLLLARRGRLNRWSVLFRALLAIPAALLSGLASLGWGVAAIVIWLIVLVRGRFPSSLFQATVAVLRFSLRTSAYVFLLSSRYPRGLFGDEPTDAAVPPAVVLPAAGTSMPPEQSIETSSDRLTLSKGARSLVVTFLVLGVFGYIGYGALLVVAANAPTRHSALADLDDARQGLNMETGIFARSSRACASQADSLACTESAEERLADGIDTFRARVDDIDHPGDTDELFSQLSITSGLFASAFHQLSRATSREDYQTVLEQVDIHSRGDAVDSSYRALVNELSR